MSVNMKLLMLGLIILYDTIYIIKLEWDKMNKH